MPNMATLDWLLPAAADAADRHARERLRRKGDIRLAIAAALATWAVIAAMLVWAVS
jgi:hypothetical protein